MPVVTRFPPSPTGSLHIGSARTALFNWLYARHTGGKFVLRIEDTDRKRSTQEAVDSILDGLAWLGLDWDGETTFQSRNQQRHIEVAEQLLAAGEAYRCYCSPDELNRMREQARTEGRQNFYDRRWRDRDPSDAPSDVQPVVRIKMPLDGETILHDLVQGDVKVDNSQLDDFILLRADGSPTYMLSDVVDDHDAGISHVIRGDDHLNNAFRQLHLCRAAGWSQPEYAHIPLIHGADGQKMSKRHGATSVQEYRTMGFLPAAVRNYLLRLGWSHGDDEIISTEQAIEWFDLDAVGKSSARFDLARLENLNAHYLRQSSPSDLVDLAVPLLASLCRKTVDGSARRRLELAMPLLTQRAKTLTQVAELSVFLIDPPRFPLADAKAAKLLEGDAPEVLGKVLAMLSSSEAWEEAGLEESVRRLASEMDIGLGRMAQPLRAALTGSTTSPGIFEVMGILGREETLSRIAAVPGLPKQ